MVGPFTSYTPPNEYFDSKPIREELPTPETFFKEIKKCLETNDDENMTIRNPWDIVKAVL